MNPDGVTSKIKGFSGFRWNPFLFAQDPDHKRFIILSSEAVSGTKAPSSPPKEERQAYCVFAEVLVQPVLA